MSQIQTRQQGALGALQASTPIVNQMIGRGITGIVGGTATKLDSLLLKTGYIPVGTVAKINHASSGAVLTFILVAGTLVANDVPFMVQSIDYAELTTKAYWQLIDQNKDGLPLVYNQTTTLFHAEVLDGASGTMKKKFDNTGVAINA